MMTSNTYPYLSPTRTVPGLLSSPIKPVPFPKFGKSMPRRPIFVEEPVIPQKGPTKAVDSAAAKVFEQVGQQQSVPPPAPMPSGLQPQPDSSGASLTPTKFTPAKRIKAKQDEDGRIVIQPSPNTRKQMATRKGFLYSIKIDEHQDEAVKTIPAKRYIGYSECGGRLSGHIFGFNHPDKKRGKLYRDASLYPQFLSWGIIRFLEPGEDPEKAETDAILATDSKKKGYNIRLGGGGGRSHKPTDVQCPYTIDQVVGMIKESYQSTDGKALKQVSRVRKGVRKEVLQAALSQADKKAQNVVYEFLFESDDGDKEKRQHHVGHTTRKFGKRVSEILSGVNNPDSAAGQALPMNPMIRANPSSARIRIFNVDEMVKKGIPTPILETAFMQYFHKERHQKVENLGAGGKGSVARV